MVGGGDEAWPTLQPQRTSQRETPRRGRAGGTRVAARRRRRPLQRGPCDEVRRRAAAHRPGQAGDRGDPPPARPRPRSALAEAERHSIRPGVRPRLGGSHHPNRAQAHREGAAAGIGRRSRHAGGRGHRGVCVVCRPDRSIGAKPGISAPGLRCDFHCPVGSGAGSGPGHGCPRVGRNWGEATAESARRRGVPIAERAPTRESAVREPGGGRQRAGRVDANRRARRDRSPAQAMERSPGHSLPDRGARRPARRPRSAPLTPIQAP